MNLQFVTFNLNRKRTQNRGILNEAIEGEGVVKIAFLWFSFLFKQSITFNMAPIKNLFACNSLEGTTQIFLKVAA